MEKPPNQKTAKIVESLQGAQGCKGRKVTRGYDI